MKRSFWHIPAWVWILGASGDMAAWFALRQLGFQGNEAIQALAVTNTFVALLWYAALTKDVADATRKQAHTSAEQMRHSQLPCVIVDTEFTDRTLFVALNIGQGPALNVVYQFEDANGKATYHHVGALQPGCSAPVPQALNLRLHREKRDQFEARRHYLLAEAVDGSWTQTENLVTLLSSRIAHKVLPFDPSTDVLAEIHKTTFDEDLTAAFRMVEGSGP